MNGPVTLDAAIHAPNRLQLCAMLAAVDEMEFAAAREALEVSESVLSKQVRVLEEAGYVKVSKAAAAGRQRTWLALTAAGRKAFGAHVAALKAVIATAERG